MALLGEVRRVVTPNTPFFQTLRRIESQEAGSGSPLGSEANDLEAILTEVVWPRIKSWMKKRYDVSQFIDCRNVGTLVAIAYGAGEGQVFLSREPAMFLTNDMIYLAPKERL